MITYTEFDPTYVNSAFMQRKFLGFLQRQKHDFSFQNKFLFERESDIISFKDFAIYEYEFKIGKADFRKDFKKKRHEYGGKPNFFYYVVSDLSIIHGNYLDYAGIYLHKFNKDCSASRFELIKEPELIRDYLATDLELYKLLRKI